jgi:hypothetical protein
VFGLAALVLLLLLIVKIAVQKADDTVAKILRLGLSFGFAAMIVNQLYAVADLYDDFPHYSYSTVLPMFAIGPILYAMIQRLSTGRAPWSLSYWPLHWLLPLGLTLAFTPYYWQSAEEKLTFILSPEARQFSALLYIANYIQNLFTCACVANLCDSFGERLWRIFPKSNNLT